MVQSEHSASTGHRIYQLLREVPVHCSYATVYCKPCKLRELCGDHSDDEGTGFLTHCISDQETRKIIQILCKIKSGPELRKMEKKQRNIYLKKLKDEHTLSIGGSLV